MLMPTVCREDSGSQTTLLSRWFQIHPVRLDLCGGTCGSQEKEDHRTRVERSSKTDCVCMYWNVYVIVF